MTVHLVPASHLGMIILPRAQNSGGLSELESKVGKNLDLYFSWEEVALVVEDWETARLKVAVVVVGIDFEAVWVSFL